MWIWIGGVIVFTGGLIALWPAGGLATYALRRRVAARSRAEAAHGLARA